MNFYGLSELSQPIEELKRNFSKDTEHIVTEKLFNTLSNVFLGKESNYYFKVKRVYDRYLTLQKTVSHFEKKTHISPKEMKNIFNEFHDNCKNFMPQSQEEAFLMLKNYVKEEYFFLKGFYNFRDSFQGIKVKVYDPNGFMGFEGKVFNYDLFHLLKYYELTIFENRKEFIEKTNQEIDIEKDKNIFYCQINSRSELSQSISFSLETTLNKDDFESRYVNKPLAKNNIYFNIFINTISGKSLKPIDINLMEAKNLFKKQYIPCIIVSLDNKQILSYCFKNSINTVDLILKINSMSYNYKIILGTNVYLSTPKINRISEIIDKLTQFYIC